MACQITLTRPPQLHVPTVQLQLHGGGQTVLAVDHIESLTEVTAGLYLITTKSGTGYQIQSGLELEDLSMYIFDQETFIASYAQ